MLFSHEWNDSIIFVTILLIYSQNIDSHSIYSERVFKKWSFWMLSQNFPPDVVCLFRLIDNFSAHLFAAAISASSPLLPRSFPRPIIPRPYKSTTIFPQISNPRPSLMLSCLPVASPIQLSLLIFNVPRISLHIILGCLCRKIFVCK